MIYENKYGKVDFWPSELDTHKNLVINFSGGTDSTLMTWMLCEKFKELGKNTEVHFSTLVDVLRPTNEWNARELILWFKERYNLNWGEHHIGYFEKGSIDDIWDKSFYHGHHTKKVRDTNGINLLIHGRTANPPLHIRREFNLEEGRETVRDIPREIIHGNRRQSYAPFAEVAKDYVAQVYKDYNLMDLFNMTASCIANAKDTEYFTKPCKTCWWCKEKLWAFGCYDYSYM